MPDFIFVHDPAVCIGCGACQVACKDQHRLLPGEFYRRVVEVELAGAVRSLSLACGHCEDPACMAACPNDAFYRTEDGLVLHLDNHCIGCGRCVWSCPLGAISLSKEHGVAHKCDGCAERLEEGLEPVCVAACVNGALRLKAADAVPLGDVLPVGSKPRIGLISGDSRTSAGGSHG